MVATGFVGPFGVQIIQCVFEYSGVAPIVLREEQNEPGVLLNGGTPDLGVRLGIVTMGRNIGFVQKGQSHFFQIDEFRFERWAGKMVLCPFSDGAADSAGPVGAENQTNFGYGNF